MMVLDQINKILNSCEKRNSFIYDGMDIFSKMRIVFRANNIKDYDIRINNTNDYIEISIIFNDDYIHEIWNLKDNSNEA